MNIFLVHQFKHLFWCSKEQSHWDCSFEYPHHMFWLRNKKININLHSYLGALSPNEKKMLVSLAEIPCFHPFCWSGSSVVRVLDSRTRAAGSCPTSVIALCAWARHINPRLVLVQPRKTRPYLTERLLMGCKESNQIKQNFVDLYWNCSM